MSTTGKPRVGAVVGAVVVLGASAVVQPNGGFISSAYAGYDEQPKERVLDPALAGQPAPRTPAVKAPVLKRPLVQKATEPGVRKAPAAAPEETVTVPTSPPK